jgi:hypothetical protein
MTKREFFKCAKGLLALAVLLLATILTGCLATAAGQSDQSSVKVSIAPPLKEISIDQDGVFDSDKNGQFEFKLANEGQETLTFTVVAKPYSVLDASYNSVSYDKETKYTQLARWISFDQTEYQLKPKEVVKIPFKVTVPDDAPSGGQYAMISVSTKADQSTAGDQTVQAIHELGMLVFGRVSGETREEAQVQSMAIKTFQPPKYDDDGQNEQAVSAQAKVKNSGNTDFAVKSHLVVEPVLGGGTVTTTEESFTVLPDTEREFTVRWADSPALGLFKVTQQVSVLGKDYQATQVVLVIPTALIIGLTVAVVLVVATVVVIVVVRRRKGGRSTIRRHGKTKLQPKGDL